jgi:uncharacterized membrane protein
MYDRVGSAAIRFAFLYIRRRYRFQMRLVAGLVALAVGLAAYFASRNVPEG